MQNSLITDNSALNLHVTPWTVRVYDWLPGNPISIGASVAAVLLLAFFMSRSLVDDPASTPGDFRLAIIYILLTAYAASAYVYVLSVSKQVAAAMTPVFGNDPAVQNTLGQIGKHVWWHMVLAGLSGALIDIYATTVTTAGSNPWVWQEQNFDAKCMRVMGPIFSGWISCLLVALAIESKRLSWLSNSVGSIDLLDLRPYRPLIRLGLTNVLLVVGLASILSLFLLEPGFVILFIQLSVMFAL
ncbi:MAG: hypothetical protein ABGY96_26930 [bacterium]|nr:hypothetical protein [Gammaproteobacteria bacterium]